MILSTVSSPLSPSSINIISSCDDDDGDTIAVDYCCCSPNHLQAQRFNNTAATCMLEHGQQSKNYEKALSILETALRICEKEKDQEDINEHFYDVCSCHSCSIDNLISVSSKCESDNNDMHDDNDNDGTTIYQNPIYVQEGHNMGSTLTHIIAFNLALVHHVRFLMTKNNNDEDIEILINKALEYYELAYECNLSDTCSLRFDEMICNNLSQIYRYQEQTEEERHFQQHQHQQQKTLELEKESLHHLQEPISVSDDEDDEDDNDNVSNSSLDDTDDLFELDYYSHDEEEHEEEYEQERKQRKRKHTHKLTTTQRQRNKLLHVVDDDWDQYPNVIDTCSVLHNTCSHSGGDERDIFQEEWGRAY